MSVIKALLLVAVLHTDGTAKTYEYEISLGACLAIAPLYRLAYEEYEHVIQCDVTGYPV